MNGAFIMRWNGWRDGVAWMLLPALFLIALLPPGYMPDARALIRGDLALTLCRVVEPRGSDLASARRADNAGSPVTDIAAAPCPFGMLPTPLVPAEPTALLLPLRWAQVMGVDAATMSWKAGAWIVGLGARGPPAR